MFKVISSAESKEMGYWDIVNSAGEVVACIESSWSWGNPNKKQLKVKDKVVCDIKNQGEAIVRLVEFFAENNRAISELRREHNNLAMNLGIVQGHYTYNLILKEMIEVEKKIKKLEEYTLK